MEALKWYDDALCAEVGDQGVFFEHDQEEEAKLICARCPVQEECLAYAFETEEPLGVWGGMSAQERQWPTIVGGPPLEAVTYTTRARSTGATCLAGRTSAGWGAACEHHGAFASARTRTDAEQAVSRPQEWCPGCARIAGGEEPKIEVAARG